MVLRNSGRVGSRRLTEESPVSDIGTGDLLFWTFAHKGYAIGDIFRALYTSWLLPCFLILPFVIADLV